MQKTGLAPRTTCGFSHNTRRDEQQEPGLLSLLRILLGASSLPIHADGMHHMRRDALGVALCENCSRCACLECYRQEALDADYNNRNAEESEGGAWGEWAPTSLRGVLRLHGRDQVMNVGGRVSEVVEEWWADTWCRVSFLFSRSHDFYAWHSRCDLRGSYRVLASDFQRQFCPTAAHVGQFFSTERGDARSTCFSVMCLCPGF